MQSIFERPTKCVDPICNFEQSKENCLLKMPCGHNLCIKSAQAHLRSIGNQEYLSYSCPVCGESIEMVFKDLLINIKFVL